MLTTLLDLDLKEIGLPFTNNSCVLLFVVRPRSEKSSFVFGLNESLPLFWCWFILVLVLLISRRTLFRSSRSSWGAIISSLESLFSCCSIGAFSEVTSLK